MATDPASFDDGDHRVLSPTEAMAEIARIRRRYRLDRFRRAVPDASPTDTSPTSAEVAARDVVNGCPVVIVGWLRHRRWESDGQTRSRVEVVARQIIVVGDGTCPSQMVNGPAVPVRYRIVPRSTCDRTPTEGGPASPRRSRRRPF